MKINEQKFNKENLIKVLEKISPVISDVVRDVEGFNLHELDNIFRLVDAIFDLILQDDPLKTEKQFIFLDMLNSNADIPVWNDEVILSAEKFVNIVLKDKGE